MASKWLPLDDPAASAHLNRFSPRAQRVVAGVLNDDSQQEEFRARQQQQQAEADERARQQQQEAQERQLKAAQAAQEEARKRQVRAGAAAGVETETDIETGRRTLATHPDGGLKYKAGPVGEPEVIGQSRSQFKESEDADPRPYPNVGIMMGGGDAALGAAGATSTETKAVFGQKVRDDRGKESYVPLEEEVDPKTGQAYIERQSPTTGKMERINMGFEKEATERAARKVLLDEEEQRLSLRANNISLQRHRFEEEWTPVKKEFDEAGRALNSFPQTFRRNAQTGKMEKIDPKTDSPIPFNPREEAVWRRDREAIQARYERAKADHDRLYPAAENLNRVERDVREKKLLLAARRIRLNSDLPDEDGGVAEILAKSEGLVDQLPYEPVVAAVTGGAQLAPTPDNTAGEPVTEAEPIAAPAPLLTPESDQEAIKSAFGTLRGIEGLEVEPRNGWSAINRNGRHIASIWDGGGSPVVVLEDAAREQDDINRTVALGQTKGVPLYLKDNGKPKNVTEEAAGVAAVFQALGDPALRDPSTGKASPALLARIEELGATPEQIKARVNNGDLSLQHGQALLKDIYGETLESEDPTDPRVYRKWLETTSKAENEALRTKYGNPNLRVAETTAERLMKAKKGTGFSLAVQDQTWKDFVTAMYVKDRGKPGVTREKYQRLMKLSASDTASGKEKAASALTAARRMITNDVVGSMFGLAAGVARDLGAAEVALFGDDDAAKTVAESLKLRNRDLANWADGAKRNLKIWTTGEGKQVSAQFEAATAAFKRTIDEQEDSGAPDAAIIAAAEQRVRDAALAMHALAPDPEWPITADHLDPDKDSALRGALARYKANADPREFDLYKERLLMSNGRRQFSAEIEKKMRGNSLGAIGSSVTGASYAGWQELGTELIADASILVTGGGSKAIQAGLRGVGAAGKAERLARLGTRIGQALDRFNEIGIRAETLANPLTRGQRITNSVVRAGKTGVQGAAGEAVEEMISEAGSDSPDFVQAGLVGALGGAVMTPAFYPMQRAAERGGNAAAERALAQANREFATRYNATMAGAPGFQAITPETAAGARVLVNPQEFQSQLSRVDAASRAVASFSAAEPDPAATKRLENLRGQISKAETALQNASPDRATAIEAQLSAMREQEQQLAASMPADDLTTRMQARKELEEAIGEMALATERAVSAANEIQSVTDAAQKTFLTGMAKAATGNIAAITQNERQAIQGARTEAGAAYFEGDRITNEGRAEMLVKFPAVGSLIQTPESQALFDSQLDAQAPTPAPAAAPTPPPSPVQSQAAAPAETAQPPAAPAAPAAPAVSQAPSAAPTVNPAQLDALEYEAYRQSNPSAPDIPTVVRNAFAAGQPVSVSMARASGIDLPDGYTRQGSLLTPPERVNETPESEQVGPEVSQDAGNVSTSTVRQQAEAAIQRAVAKMPSLADRFVIEETEATEESAGGYTTHESIVINLGDLEQELSGYDPEGHAARVDAILHEEIVHFAQFEAVRRNGENMVEFYSSLWNELTPEQQEAAAATYQESFDALPKWAKGAEAVRMLIQERQAGTVTELTKVFSRNMPARLIALLRSAAEYLRSLVTSGEIPQRIQEAINGIEAVLAEFEGRETQAEAVAPEPGQIQPAPVEPAPVEAPAPAVQETNGFRVESSDGTSRITRDGATLWQGPEAEADAQLVELQSAEFSPLRVSGLAIAAARERFPEIKGKLRQQLESLTEDIADAIEALPPEERRGAVDRAIDEWMADRNAPKAKRQIDAPAKTRAYQILNSGEYPTLSAVFQSGTKIAPRPNLISLILARRKAGAKLTNREIDLLQNAPEYDGMVTQSQFANSGAGRIAREILALITARQGEGTRPDVMAGYLGENVTASDLWDRLSKELGAIANGTRLESQSLDPNRERTEAEITAELATKPKQSTAERQEAAFEAANVPENGEAFYVEDFTPESVGNTVTVDGEEMRITAVNMDSLGIEVESVVLDDHVRFGRQELESGEVVYVQTPEVEEGALFSSPTPGSLRRDLVSAFNLPPSEYNFQPSDENRSAIQEALSEFALRAVRSGDLAGPTRSFEARTGAAAVFYDGGQIQIAGFVSKRNPEVIFINAGRSDIPIAWTLAHELTHVAQKDPRANAGQIRALIAEHLTEGEHKALEDIILQRGYKVDDLPTEIPAFVMAEAVSGYKDIGIDAFERGAELQEALIHYFDELPTLRPGSLADNLDDGLAKPLGARNLTPDDAGGTIEGVGRRDETRSSARPFDAVRSRIVDEGNARGRGMDEVDEGQAPPSLNSSPSARTEEAAKQTDPEPSEAQIEAGNYRKGKVTLHGMRISIENARGSTRSGVDSKGKPWSVQLAHHYGYFLGTEARDGDHVDVFIGENPESEKVFIVNQINPDTRRFDEHKVMLGFNTRREAIDGYLANYSPGWKGLGDMVETDVATLRQWLENGDTKRPARLKDLQQVPVLKSSPTKASDAEYLAAVKRGDMETAQRMVDEAARAAGYDAARGFHGSGDKFDRFSHEHGGKVTDAESAKSAFFFTDSRRTAETYAKKAATFSEDKKVRDLMMRMERAEKVGNWDLAETLMMEMEEIEFGEGAVERREEAERENATIYDVYLKGRFLVLDAENNSYLSLRETHDFKRFDGNLSRALEYARKKGYDGVEIQRFDDAINDSDLATHWAVFHPSQIKSADPVTYDANGNVIPLSERFDSSKDSILYSSPSPDSKAAVDAALAAMPPIYRQVFEAVSNGATPQDVMKRFSISERAVTNILNQVRSRITTAMGAASADGLVPVMRDGKFDGGRPDLALSTNPAVAATDQIRNESGIPDVRGWDEVNAEAEKMLQDYQGAYDALLAKARDLQPMTDTEVAATKKIIANETLAGKIQSPAERVKIAMLIHGYRDLGTEDARRLAIRRDPTQKPAERHAQFIAEALFTPDPETRKRLKEAGKGQAESILAGWMARVDSIKSDLLAQGIDIDASLAAYHAAETKRKQSEADNPRVKAVLDQTIRKLSKREKSVIEAIRSGALLSKAAFLTGMDVAEVKDVYSRFMTDIRKAMAESAKRYLEGSLASSPTDMMGAILAELGLPDISLIDDTVPGFKDRRNEKPKKPREPKQKEAPAEPTPEQKAKWDRLAEEFFARPMSTWRTLWQDEMKKLDPVFAQKNFAFKEADLIQPWKDLWQTEMPGVAWSEPKFREWAGAEPARKQTVLDLFQAKLNELRGSWQAGDGDFLRQQGELIGGQDYRGKDSKGPWQAPAKPINETTGEWSESRTFSGQGELIREAINETTGTFDLNDPLAVKAVIDAFAIARGRKMDALVEFWRASILTGPQTHIVNFGSNALNAAYNLLPKRAAEATINSLLGLVGQGSEKSATFSEFKPMAKNLRKGFQLAARNALRSWQIEGRVFESYARAEALQLDFTGVGSEYIPPALGGKIGKVMRSLSFRAMTACDEFMKSAVAQMEAAAHAHRIAKVEEKLSGAAYEARMDELMQPGSVAWIRAIDDAKRVTFQEDINGENPRAVARLDQFAELAKRGRNMPWIGRPLTFFLPFVDTPLNVFKQAIDMSPIGGALAVIDGARALRRRVLRGDIPKEVAAAEAAKLYDRARFVRDVTNQTLGVMTFLALQGLVVPDDDDELPVITGTVPYKTTKRGERDNAYATMPPQTIRIGDLRFSYARVEPFATFLASTVDLLVEMNRHGGFKPEVASQWLARFKDQSKDKTFLAGVSDLLNALEDPDRFAERLTANIATGFIPNIIRQPIRESDKFIRDQNPGAEDGFFTAVGKRIGYSIYPQAAPVKTDVWGRQVLSNPGELMGGTRPTDLLFRIVDPTNAQVSTKVDPLDLWIFRFNLETADSKDRLSVEPIPNAIRGQVPGERHSRTFALTAEEQAAANREAGQMARAMLGDGWEKMERSYENAKRIKEAVSEAQDAVRKRLRFEKIAEAQKSQ